ncbi:MAG: diaminopimelate dehydrogenase [Oscillospiraceae bacterium]|nr:diaminopimelate dehydrogenase [Oscillospiraceae bacterium]
MEKIKIGIMGYGNLGRGVECALSQNDDMALSFIFTRRDPSSIKPLTDGIKVVPADMAPEFADKTDVLILCGGSSTDLPVQTPKYAEFFNVVDSFDTHAHIPEHFAAVDAACLKGGHTALISAGWDPGMFSLARLYSSAVLPSGKTYTFWGRGVSQGHSDAIRRIDGVLDARQYTVPVDEAVKAAREGSVEEFSARQMHTRECWVVAAEGSDREAIREKIVSMPNYFADYDTTVNFISQEELNEKHRGLPHGGFVIRSGKNGANGEHTSSIEYSLKLDSNPEFTSLVLVAFARAVYRLSSQGQYGCKTVFDIPPALLSPLTPEQLRHELL